MRSTSKSIEAASASLIRRVSSMTTSVVSPSLICAMVSVSEQFFRRTQDRQLMTAARHNCVKFLHDRRVSNVSTIPRQEYVNAMHRRDANMDRIAGRLLRKQARLHDRLRDTLHSLRELKQREVVQKHETPCGCCRVSSCRFVKHDFRDAEIVFLPLVVPPVMCDLLPCRLNEVAAGPSGQIARNRRLNINAFCHVAMRGNESLWLTTTESKTGVL